jgi:uncharacterized pyridoxamine 5'-phosphate oxidase family protein
VRTFLLWYADESGFYFVPLSTKQVTEQLKRNPKLELCFFNNAADPAEWKHLRVMGEAEFLEDKETLDRAYENRSFLDPLLGFSAKPFLRPFRVAAGEAYFWTLPDNLKNRKWRVWTSEATELHGPELPRQTPEVIQQVGGAGPYPQPAGTRMEPEPDGEGSCGQPPRPIPR